MHWIRKFFCRTYQTGFRIIYPFLPYREPEILKSTTEIPEKITRLHLRSVLIVTDPFLKESGRTAELENSLTAHGIPFKVYDKTKPNPTVKNVDEVYRLYQQIGADCMIAFGGGSAMDCAKAAGSRIAYRGRSLDKLKGNLRIYRKLPPLFAVPTTAGTGSEATLTAVITDAEKKHKYTMNSFPLIPAYAVLDPKNTYTLPPHLTATTGMDALTHAVEAYIGQSTTKETRRLALEASKLIIENIETAYKEPTNYAAREAMLHAAYKAGIAFSKSYVGYIHAVAHSLGGQYNTPHGLANSVLLPIGLEIYGQTVYTKLQELAVYTGIADKNDTPKIAAKKFISKIYALNAALGIPKTITGILPEDIPAMAKHGDKEGNPLYPVPILMDAKELEIFYQRVADWSRE